MRRSLVLASLATILALAVAGPALAAKPETERIVLHDSFLEPDLTAACGFDVHLVGEGHITFRLFSDESGAPVRELNNYAIRLTLSSEWASLRMTDVGADRVAYLPDGSLILIVIGNVQSVNIPGEGRVYFDVGRVVSRITFDANGEPTFTVLSEAGQHEGDQVDAICAALGG